MRFKYLRDHKKGKKGNVRIADADDAECLDLVNSGVLEAETEEEPTVPKKKGSTVSKKASTVEKKMGKKKTKKKASKKKAE